MDEKIRRKNIFLTYKIARNAFCVGELFYPMIFFTENYGISKIKKLTGLHACHTIYLDLINNGQLCFNADRKCHKDFKIIKPAKMFTNSKF